MILSFYSFPRLKKRGLSKFSICPSKTENEVLKNMAVVTVESDRILLKGYSFKVMVPSAKQELTWKELCVVGLVLVIAAGKGLVKGKEAFKHGFFIAFARSFKGKTKAELYRFSRKLV